MADPAAGSGGAFALQPIGVIRSAIRSRAEAPRQGREGAPDAWLELDAACAAGLRGLEPGQEIVVVTWLHQGRRDVLEVRPRGRTEGPLLGVFGTRSPDRPNPIGLHRVTIREIDGTRLKVGPIEAIDGTPVVDIKRVLDCSPETVARRRR